LFSPPNNLLPDTFKRSSFSATAGSTVGTNILASRVGLSANVYKYQGSSERCRCSCDFVLGMSNKLQGAKLGKEYGGVSYLFFSAHEFLH
jgi:hypothetical protein